MKYIPLLLIITLFSACFGKKPENTGLEGKEMPSFKFLLSDSTTYFETKSIAANKPIVLFYFGPRCPYSKSQMQEILSNINKLQDIQFIVFTTARFSEMKSFYNNYKLHNYKNIKTGVDYSNHFIDYFSPKGVPFLAIYGTGHRLNQAFSGETAAGLIKKVAYN